MNEILVVVKPVFDVIDDGAFDEKETMTERVHIEHCYSCGSPYMYIRREKDFGEKIGVDDYTWYCAVCGACQGGIMIDNSSLQEKEKPRAKK